MRSEVRSFGDSCIGQTQSAMCQRLEVPSKPPDFSGDALQARSLIHRPSAARKHHVDLLPVGFLH
jgi:hypothetical protein